MNAKLIEQNHKLNLAKWIIIVFFFAAGLFANSYFAFIALPLRVIGWIILFGILLGIAAFTSQGKKAIDFAKEARMELRKVIWPTRQETVQTTLLVIAFVVVMGLLLWGLDSILLWIVGLLTGQRG